MIKKGIKKLDKFLYNLPAIIANADEGDEISCFNILQYIRHSYHFGNNLADEVIEYIRSSFSRLSKSEIERLAMGILAQSDHPFWNIPIT